MARIVAIEPFENDKVFGDFSYSGEVTKLGAGGKKEVIAAYIGAQSLNISGLGIVLDRDNPEEELIYQVITEGREVKAFFTGKKDGSRGTSQRFKIRDNEADAKKFIEARTAKKKVEEFIDTLKTGGKLRNFGRIFNILGSEEMVYANLLKLVDTDKGREQISKYMLHNDRGIIELLHLAMEHGNSAEKSGVYKLPNSMFYFNEIPMGLGIDMAIAFLKKTENAEFYQALKDQYLGNSGGTAGYGK